MIEEDGNGFWKGLLIEGVNGGMKNEGEEGGDKEE